MELGINPEQIKSFEVCPYKAICKSGIREKCLATKFEATQCNLAKILWDIEIQQAKKQEGMFLYTPGA